MKPKIIKTADEYDKALAYVESLMDAKPGSREEEELELWSLLIERSLGIPAEVLLQESRM